MPAGRWRGLCRASAAGAGSRKYAQIRRRRHAVRIRRLLDRRRSRRGLAGRRPRDRRICRPVPWRWVSVSRVFASPPHKGLVMNALIAVLRELIGLFVDDGSLALMILAVVILAGIFSTLLPGLQLAAGARLLFWVP